MAWEAGLSAPKSFQLCRDLATALERANYFGSLETSA